MLIHSSCIYGFVNVSSSDNVNILKAFPLSFYYPHMLYRAGTLAIRLLIDPTKKKGFKNRQCSFNRPHIFKIAKCQATSSRCFIFVMFLL